MKSFIACFIFTLSLGTIGAQTPAKPAAKAIGKKSENNFIILKTGGGFGVGMADLGKRFSSWGSIPVSVYAKKSNITFGLSYQPFLGNRVNIGNLYGGILGNSQIIYDIDGFPALIRYYMRGFAVQGKVGGLFQPTPKWQKSRIEVAVGAGMMQHRIRARFDVGSVPQLENDYAPGYDRLCNGLLLSQTVNFHYLNTETVSLFAGIEFGQGLTRNRRNWDYSTMQQDNTLRKDLYLGFNAGILIPIALKQGNKSETDYYD
jgi:hypothetical protein